MNKKSLFSSLLWLSSVVLSAQNPFVQTWCTSDPAPMVYGDKVLSELAARLSGVSNCNRRQLYRPITAESSALPKMRLHSVKRFFRE